MNLYAEGRHWLTRSVRASPDAPPLVRARAFTAAGWLGHQQRDFFQTKLDLTDAVVQARTLDDIRLRCKNLFLLCTVLLVQDELDRPQPITHESLALARTTNDPSVLGVATH